MEDKQKQLKDGLKDFIKWKEIYDDFTNKYNKKDINKNYIRSIFSKYKVSSIDDFYNDDGTFKEAMTEYKYTSRNRPPQKIQKKLTNEEKNNIEFYKNDKLPLEEATAEFLNKYPIYKDYIKNKNGDKFLPYKSINNNYNDIIKETATTAEELKEDTKQIKQNQAQTNKAGFEAVERQNRINDALKEKLKEQGLTIDQMHEIINETNKLMEADKAERQAEKADKKRSKAFKELVKEMSQQDDITTTDKGELIKRLLKNHNDIIHDEETAKAAADAIFRTALNKKVVSKKQRQYLYNFYKAYPQFVEQLPEEQQEAINAEIMDKYNEQQKNKILHYMLPKERPRWEKATTQHNINPMLGRRSYG